MTKSGGKARRPYLNQKIDLYFDENFPREVIADLKRDKGWKRKCRFYSVYDFGNENKDDSFQFGFCKGKGFTLVTLDDDFFNDTLYPFNGFPGIIKIVTSGNDLDSIRYCLDVMLLFLIRFPRPKRFLIDTKLKISQEGAMIRGRDAKTGEIKTCPLVFGKTSVGDLLREFHYFSVNPHL